MGFYLNEDRRVHINLSNFARNILYEDMFIFYRSDINNISGFINDIFLNFYQEASSSIQARCDELSSRYETLFSEQSINVNADPSITYTIINVIIESYKKKIFDTINNYSKDGYKKIKLRTAVADILSDSDEEPFYNNNVGNYLKAIVEEYAHLPFLKRERIICKANYDAINRALHYKKQLKVYVKSGKEFNVIPYKLSSDKLGMFNYLIGINSDTKVPVSYRIANAKLKVTSKSAKITNEYKELIENKISNSDVSFLSNNTSKIIVELDKYGIQKYNNQLHLRPKYLEILDHNKYVFNCSEDQIKFYFIKFGSSAKILEPSHLSKYFQNFYRYALRKYEGD